MICNLVSLEAALIAREAELVEREKQLGELQHEMETALTRLHRTPYYPITMTHLPTIIP
jgi:hypothetical protein